MIPPRAAILFGAAGLLPFLWAAALAQGLPPVPQIAASLHAPKALFGQSAQAILLGYGTVILCFMSGVLWGFATHAPARLRSFAFGASTLPALYVFFVMPAGASGISALFWGFLGLLALELPYIWLRLTPRWWLSLRLPLTAVVCAALYFGNHGAI